MFLAVGVVIRCGSWRGSPQQLQLTSLQLCCCLLKRCEEKPTGLDGVEKGVGEAAVLLIYLSNLSRLCLLSVRRFNRPCVHMGAANLSQRFDFMFHLLFSFRMGALCARSYDWSVGGVTSPGCDGSLGWHLPGGCGRVFLPA